MTLRNGEQLLLTLVIPLVLLVGLSRLPADVVGPRPGDRRRDARGSSRWP